MRACPGNDGKNTCDSALLPDFGYRSGQHGPMSGAQVHALRASKQSADARTGTVTGSVLVLDTEVAVPRRIRHAADTESMEIVVVKSPSAGQHEAANRARVRFVRGEAVSFLGEVQPHQAVVQSG